VGNPGKCICDIRRCTATGCKGALFIQWTITVKRVELVVFIGAAIRWPQRVQRMILLFTVAGEFQ